MDLDIAYGIGCIAGPLLFVGAFTSGYKAAPRYVRIGLVISGLAITGWGILGLMLVVFCDQLSSHAWSVVSILKTVLSGMGLGVLILLLSAGGLPIWPWRKDFSSTDPGGEG